MAVAISQTANPAGVANVGATVTYSNISIGAAATDRIVVICVGSELASASPNSATIDYGTGAQAMSVGTLGVQGAVYSRIFRLPAPTGTTANVVITFGVGPANTANHIAAYRVVGAATTPTAESAAGDTDADPISVGPVTIPTDGGMIAVMSDATDTTARTWTGITMDIDADAGSFRFSTGTSTTAGTPTVTVSGGNNEDGAFAYIIFGPPARKKFAIIS